MSRPPGRAAGLLISLVTLTTAQQTPSPSSLPNQYSPDKRIPQWTDLGLTAACGVLMLILLSLVVRMTRAHLDAPPRRLVQADTFSKEGQRWSWDFVLLLPIRDEDALQDAPKRQQDVDLTDAAGLVGDLVMQAQKPKDPLVLKYTLSKVASSIKQAGLDVCVFKSRDYDRAVVKVRATVGRLRKHAAQTGFVAKLRDREVKDRLRRGLEDIDAPGEYKIYPRRDNWTYKGVPMDTSIRDTEGRAPLYLYYEHCYGPFVDREDARRLYEKYPRSESCFRGVDRIKLLMSILSAPTRDGGAGLPLDKLVRRKACDAAFPLHEEDELKSLEARWIRMWARPAQLPSERVRSYFGEKIAFYYLFLAHATTYFSYAAVIGFAVFLNTLISPEAENAASVPYFCAFMGLWATFFIETWKRKESRHAMEWGTIGFEDVERDRPEYAEDPLTVVTNSPIDGMETTYFPVDVAAKRKTQSTGVIVLAIIGVCIVVYSIFLLNVALKIPSVEEQIDPHSWWNKLPSFELRSTIIGIVTTIQIMVLERLYLKLAEKMTDREGHRTDTAYEDALIGKTFVFTFVNAYATFFYTAFFKQVQSQQPGAGILFPSSKQRLFECQVDQTGVPNCMFDLRVQLSSIFISRVLAQTLLDVVPSYVLWAREQRRVRLKRENDPFRQEDAAVQFKKEQARWFPRLRRKASTKASSDDGEEKEERRPRERARQETISDVEVDRSPCAAVWKLTIEPTRPRGRRRVDGVESPRHRTDAATETTTKQHRSAAEDEFLLSEYHVTMGPFKDYAQLVVIYGFGILFVAAYPLGPFLAALYCFVQIRVGGWRLCLRTRRAWPAGAEDIGTWSAIVDLMSYLAVIVNGLLLTYTGQFVVNNPWWMRALIFVLFTHALFLVKGALAIFIDDIPSDVRLQIERQAFAKDKLVSRLPDATLTQDLTETNEEEWVDLTIADADNDEVYLDVPGYENYFAEDALPIIDEEAKEEEEESVLSSSAASSSEASASASDDDDASTGSSSYESYTASSASYSGASDDDSAGAAWAAGAAGAGAAAVAGTAYAAGGHSAELDYNGPELAHSAELDYQGGSNEMV